MLSFAQASDFVAEISNLKSTNAFNPYTDVCPLYDNIGSPSIRFSNLVSVLHSCGQAKRCSLWIARDLGYRGGRRTGVPLTDEVHLNAYGNSLGLSDLRKATAGPLVSERTASIVQALVACVGHPVFMWNIFPLHPFEKDNHLSNRKHTSAERGMSRFAIRWLIANLNVSNIVAIGRDAQISLAEMGISASSARHPSYGGQRDFIQTIGSLYGNQNPGALQFTLL